MQTSLDFLRTGQPWPPEGEAERIKEMQDHIDISNGNRDAFKHLKKWLEKNEKTKDMKLHVKVDWPKKATNVLVNGVGQPSIALSSDGMDIADWLKKCQFFSEMESAVRDWSRCGQGLLKVSRSVDEVIIRAVPPTRWIPVAYPDDDRRFQAHVIFQQKTKKDDVGAEYTEIQTETHTKDEIRYQLWIIKSGKLEEVQNLRDVEAYKNYDLDSEGYQDNPAGWCVFPIFNVRTSDQSFAQPDATYSDVALSQIEAIEIAQSQIRFQNRQHAHPVTVVSDDLIDPDRSTDAAKVDLEAVKICNNPDADMHSMVAYIAPSLESVDKLIAEIELQTQQYINTTELSAPMVSGLDAANIASGRALMLELTPTLDHLKRCIGAFSEALPSVLESASRLGLEGFPKFNASQVAIDWEVSIAQDPTETAQRTLVLRQADVLSVQAALRANGYSEEEIEQIMAERAEEQQAGAVEPIEPLHIEIPAGGE